MRNRLMLTLIIIWPVVAFFLILYLYNIWFDTWDKIKYDTTYSPEFDQDKNFENVIYWTIFIFSISFEALLIYLFVKIKKVE